MDAAVGVVDEDTARSTGAEWGASGEMERRVRGARRHERGRATLVLREAADNGATGTVLVEVGGESAAVDENEAVDGEMVEVRSGATAVNETGGGRVMDRSGGVTRAVDGAAARVGVERCCG